MGVGYCTTNGGMLEFIHTEVVAFHLTSDLNVCGKGPKALPI